MTYDEPERLYLGPIELTITAEGERLPLGARFGAFHEPPPMAPLARWTLAYSVTRRPFPLDAPEFSASWSRTNSGWRVENVEWVATCSESMTDWRATIVRFDDAPPYPTASDCLESLLELMTLTATTALGGLPLHAAAAVHRGRGYVVIGPSGAGKTTFARTQCEDSLVTDEHASCVPIHGTWWLLPAPFHGREHTRGQRLAAPLAACLLISPDNRGHTAVSWEVPRREAVHSLLDGAISTRHDKDERTRLLSASVDLATSVPVGRLSFQLGDDVWPLLEELP